jgi:hypothetical protein
MSTAAREDHGGNTAYSASAQTADSFTRRTDGFRAHIKRAPCRIDIMNVTPFPDLGDAVIIQLATIGREDVVRSSLRMKMHRVGYLSV